MSKLSVIGQPALILGILMILIKEVRLFGILLAIFGFFMLAYTKFCKDLEM